MSRVSLQQLTKRYRQQEVVKGVDLEIGEGELVVLLGPSGCGKTTTLRMVAGFTEPTSGEIRIGGVAMTGVPSRARRLGMVFQDYALFPNMNVADNIAFGLVERREPAGEIRARVGEMLRLTRLAGFEDRYPVELSGGQQQRVALARALAYRPSVLLMDEPLGALDQKLREEMQAEFARIQRALAITTIFVTHDQQEAMALADRIVVMNGGVIEQAGPPEALYDEPASLFIAGFVGRSNRIEGAVEGTRGGEVAVRTDDGGLILARPRGPVAGRVTCVIRPERLHLAAMPVDGLNSLPARQLRRAFCGASLEVAVAAGGGELLVQVARGEALPEGEAVVCFAPADTLCFPA
jgi:ABC-type Fe3+/spermidine/putrescine transport system ATPase subunit